MSVEPSPKTAMPAQRIDTGTETRPLTQEEWQWNLKLRDDALRARDAECDRLKYINAKLSEVLAGMELQQKEDGLWLMFPGAGFNFRTLSGPITRRNLLAWFEAARAALARAGSPS